MRCINALLTVPLMLMLTGCVWETGTITETIGNVTTTTASAIVARDTLYTGQHIQRDIATEKMYMVSGIKLNMDYREYKLENGGLLIVPLITELTVREKPSFQQDLAIEPPDHRVWDTVDLGLKSFLKGFGIYWLADWGKHGQDTAAVKYNGSYSQDSNNTTTTQIPYAPSP